MGFFARLFGSSKSAPSATVPADSAPKPENEVQAEQPVASAPEAVQSIAQEPEPAPPEQPTASAPEVAPEAVHAEPAPPEQPITSSTEAEPAAPEVLESEPESPEQPIEAASPAAPEADEPEPEDDEEETEPAPEPFPALAPDEVIYVLTTFGVDSIDPTFMATKKLYRAGSRQAAVAFLRTQVVTETLFYIEVETPDGPFGIDNRQRVFNTQGQFVDF